MNRSMRNAPRGARRPSRDLEYQIQKAAIQWLAYEEKKYPELRWLYAIPNGGLRNPVVAAKLKAMGVRSGVVDLCLPVARGGYHGLYIEVKSDTGNLTPAQRDFLMFVEQGGYATAVCRTPDEIRQKILKYLDMPKTQFGVMILETEKS